MALLAYNLTGAPVPLAAGSPIVTLPISSNPPNRGPAVNVTSELRPNATVDPTNGIAGGVDAAGYVALQAQAASVQFEWTGDAEYLTTGLTAGGPTTAHASSHQSGGADVIAELTDVVESKGSIAVAQLIQTNQPIANDTLSIGADVYEADGAGANINFAIAGSAEATMDNLLAAIQASGTENIVADKLSATTLRVRSADAPNGTAIASDPSIALDASSLTNYSWDAGDVNMNTLAGKAEAKQEMAAVSLTITTAMITATTARLAFPFTPTLFTFSAVTAAGVPVAFTADALNIVGDDIVLTLGTDLANTDVLTVVAYA